MGSTRSAALALLVLAAGGLAGCSQDFETSSDVYVPRVAEERYPIRVIEKPVKLTLQGRAGSLKPDQVNSVSAFARDARSNATSAISIAYPKGSRQARNTAHEALRVLTSHGVPRSMVHVSARAGASSSVTLSFTRKVAVTQECGDWSSNVMGNQYNETYSNYGCALQHNTAAMVANPEDFERPRGMPPALAGARGTAMETYVTGKWTVPNSDPGFSEESGSDSGSSGGSGSSAPTN